MWIRKEQLLKVDNYASIPYAFQLDGDLFRIFYSSRNSKGQSLPYYVDVIVKDGNIKIKNNEPKDSILKFGELGTFDDSGIMPSCIVKNNEKLYMYYIGWNPQKSVSYRLSIGLAISEDGGNTFHKYSQGPILDRSLDEPYFNTAPYVVKENDVWKMWYVSCTGWVTYEGQTEPVYNIKYCESNDGINWIKNNITCIDYTNDMQAIGRPCIFKNNDVYELYFSYRKSTDYRSNKNNSYKIGKAVSKNGIQFFDYENNLIKSNEFEWDFNMNEYCHIFLHENIKYMIYNGNDFGKSGFGYAIEK